MTRTTLIRYGASLLATATLGGCVEDIPLAPDHSIMFWEEVKYPGRHYVRTLALDPAGRLFLGVSGDDTGHTISRSTDNGETWAITQFESFRATQISADSQGRLFATTASMHEGLPSYDGGVLRSLDHGQTWSPVLPGRGISDLPLVIDQDDGLWLPVRQKTLGAEMRRLYFSGDHGASWTLIEEPFLSAGTLLAFGVNSRGCIIAMAEGGLYASCDRGGAWNLLLEQEWYQDSGLAIDSEDRLFVFKGTTLYSSNDDGATWSLLTLDYWPGQIVVDPKDRLYATSSRSVHVSEDNGQTWNLVAEFGYRPRNLVTDGEGTFFVVGFWGLYRSIDDGTSWELLGFSEYSPVDIAVAADGSLFVGLIFGGVHRLAGEAGGWERFNAGLSILPLYCLASAAENRLLAATWNGIYISPTDRPAWNRASDIRANNISCFPGDTIAAFGLNAMNVWLSLDGGDSWEKAGLDGYNVSSVVRTGDGNLLACANFGGVFRYTGEGILWDQMNEGLDDLRVNALSVMKDGVILAGTETGIFVSSDSCRTWRRFSTDRTPVRGMLAAGGGVIIAHQNGVSWIGDSRLKPVELNDGLPYRPVVEALKAGPGDHVYLFANKCIYRSRYAATELPPGR